MARGSIEKRGERSWRLRVDLGFHPDGRRNRPSTTVTIDDGALLRTTKRLNDYLEDQLSEFKRKVLSGNYIAPEKMTLSEFIPVWREKHGVKHLSPTVLATYNNIIKNHIVPNIGHLVVSDVKVIEMVNFMDYMSQPGRRKDGKKGPLSGTSQRYVYRVINDIFQRAVEWQLISENPVNPVKKPAIDTKEREVLIEDEILLLFESLNKEPLAWRSLIELAVTTGLRRGELLGIDINKHLRTEIINDKEVMFLDVRDNVVKGEGEIIIKDVKSSKSERSIALNPEVVPIVRQQMNEVRKNKLLAGDKWEAEDRLLLHGQWNGLPRHPDSATKWFDRFRKRYGISEKKVTLHGLRHTYATYLLYKGYTLKDIQELLGHSDIRITGGLYTHYLKEMNVRASEAFSDLKKSIK